MMWAIKWTRTDGSEGLLGDVPTRRVARTLRQAILENIPEVANAIVGKFENGRFIHKP